MSQDQKPDDALSETQKGVEHQESLWADILSTVGVLNRAAAKNHLAERWQAALEERRATGNR